ncbi:MAG: DUF6615 family protein [Pseudanabaenaceae cyanobacterium bins.39]|nr:DUF6615 family protein [Pseudanabaenaceae cyanobacterium bins.39]
MELFEKLASSTWQRIFYANQHEVSQGEETITDINLLEIAMSQSSEVTVVKTDKYREKDQGTDWEWWIGNSRIGYLRYAVQAKKIDAKFTKYKYLKHKVDSVEQSDILERHAQNNGAIPLYCFYNYSKNTDLSPYWHCNLPPEYKQLGCTVTPLKNVKKAINQWGKSTFDFLHTPYDTKPWRCLVYCPSLLQVYESRTAIHTSWGFGDVSVFPRLPENLSHAIETNSTFRLFNDHRKQLDYLDDEFYREGYYPKRILVANYLGDNL